MVNKPDEQNAMAAIGFPDLASRNASAASQSQIDFPTSPGDSSVAGDDGNTVTWKPLTTSPATERDLELQEQCGDSALALLEKNSSSDEAGNGALTDSPGSSHLEPLNVIDKSPISDSSNLKQTLLDETKEKQNQEEDAMDKLASGCRKNAKTILYFLSLVLGYAFMDVLKICSQKAILTDTQVNSQTTLL